MAWLSNQTPVGEDMRHSRVVGSAVISRLLMMAWLSEVDEVAAKGLLSPG